MKIRWKKYLLYTGIFSALVAVPMQTLYEYLTIPPTPQGAVINTVDIDPNKALELLLIRSLFWFCVTSAVLIFAGFSYSVMTSRGDKMK